MQQCEIRLSHVKKAYGQQVAIADLSLTIPAGKRTVLLGPSGCGKTSVLRMIAGLEAITGGQLYLGGRLANHLEPGERSVAMVFQNYALYPHLSVLDNIAYALKAQKLSGSEVERRIRQAMEMLQLTGYETRKPRELSGGQRQRVALARALVKEAPYFLLDEPLSNLDAQLRTHARTELVKLHQWMKSTLVYVTHDQVEAMTVGQHIAVMNEGCLQQVGTPEEIYDWPANTFVASFIGNPAMNLVLGRLTGSYFSFAGGVIPLSNRWLNALESYQGESLYLGIRPEYITLREETSDLEPDFPVRVEWTENWGQQRIYCLAIGETQVMVSAANDRSFTTAFLQCQFDDCKLRFFRAEDGRAVIAPERKLGLEVA